MKKLVLIAALVFGGAVHAAEVPAWQQKLEAYKASLGGYTNAGLRLHYGFYAGMALTTCSLSAVVTGATFVADTVPVGNVVSESLANITNPDYQTYKNILEWENLGAIGRGAVGGGPVAMLETLQFIGLWLGGNEDQAWEGVKKTYASTIATANALFAEQGQCMMSISKVMIIRAELKARQEQAKLPSPMRVPVELNRP